MTVTSRAFAAGGAIPREFTCDGADVSPPLRFGGVPVGTRELDLTVTDPDAPGGGFVHWAVTGLPPALRSLPRGARPAHEARNGFGVTGYRGPCPPPGPPHRYVFRVEARAGARSAPLAVGELVGRYGRRP